MTARLTDCTALCVFIPEGGTAAEFDPIRDVLEEAAPDYWMFVQPDTFMAFFVTNRNGPSRADRTVKLLAALKDSHSQIRDFRTGRASGQMVCEFAWFGFGRMKSMPLGEVANDAQKNARSAA